MNKQLINEIKKQLKEIKTIRNKLYHGDSLNKENKILLANWFEIYSNQLKELEYMVHMEPYNLTQDCLDNIDEIKIKILYIFEKVNNEKKEYIKTNKNYVIEKQIKNEWYIINDQCINYEVTDLQNTINKKCKQLKHGIYRVSTKENKVIFKKLINGGITFDLTSKIKYIPQDKYIGI